MNIEVNVSDVDLSSVVGNTVFDYADGEPQPKTLADQVAFLLVRRIAKNNDYYDNLQKRVRDIRDEEIRALVAPAVAEAFNQPLNLTNSYGESSGQVTTLRELIMQEAKKVFNGRDRSGYGDESLGRKLIREEVGAALKQELSEAVKAEREKVVAAVRASAADLIADAVAKGVGQR